MKLKLSDLNPDIDFEVCYLRITPENIFKIIGDYDLIFDKGKHNNHSTQDKILTSPQLLLNVEIFICQA